jgi:hypothetical protein
MSYDQFLGQIANLMKSGSRSNAFAPLVWLCGTVLLCCFGGMYYFKEPLLKYWLLGLCVFVVIYACIMYLCIFLKDPKLLQSENYRIEDRKLDIIASKGEGIQFNPVDLTTPTKAIGGGKKHE